MKKIIRKVKGKKVLSFVLAVIMLATTFNIALPMLKLDASAAGSITTQDGAETITQTQIVTSDRQNTYDNYAAQFLDGASRPTDIVIPGLLEAQDYTIQGMTYYAPRDWMLVTAYHNYNSDNDAKQFSSKVFAIDAATGEFVAMFSFLNPDGSENVDHGGGIAVSEHNIYYACGDADRKIAYAPITALENAQLNTHTVIQLAGEHVFTEVGSVDKSGETAYTAYVCYDEGVLWTGNFYDPGVKILGVSVAATDYSVAANSAYNSMIFGYELKGDNSLDEWNNLIGASSSIDCQGNPSYAIGLNNTIKDVQYATVDNGKLYLSCSFGTGEGTMSVSLGGMNPYSQLIVADIDLSVPGTKDVTIATTNGTRAIKAYDIQSFQTFSMMPMSEGLCVIEDKIYITFESASNKYLKEAGTLTGNCNHPVDVIWELDPHALMEIEKAEPESSIYYEKVNSNADIVSGEEYMIVYESDEVDPITQQKILYAFNADGNFKDHKLSKSAATNLCGYDGMVGHPITEYAVLKAGEQDALGNTYSRDILYLDDKEKDDIEGVRWTITNIGGTKYNIRTTETYFADCNSFYFDGSRITMLPNTATDLLGRIDISQLEAGNGYFYFSNNGEYLWCNDGLEANYNTKANAYYSTLVSSNPTMFTGLTETPGTIHCHATGSSMLGGSILAAEEGKAQAYPDGAFQIYRRVTDGTASTYESRVFTDLNAELQADGTYTIDLETYAISPNHYQYVGERPTDYILVADTSSSMASAGSTALIEYNGDLAVSSLSVDSDTSDDRGKGINGYGLSNPEEDIYIKHSDGKYYKVYMGVNTTELSYVIGIISQIRQKYYVYYIADDGYYYCVQDHTTIVKRNQAEWKAWIESGENESDYSTQKNNSNRKKESVYTGVHYRFDKNADEGGKYTRIGTIKTVANDLIDDIAAQNPNNRIALVQYGSATSYLAPGGWASSGYTNAFWNADDNGVSTLKTQVNNLGTTTQTNNSGIEFDAANAIIDNSDAQYDSDGNRNVVVIFMSDGIPGADDNSATASAANAVLSKAYAAKKKGAFVYSVMTGQASVSGFNKKTYMEAVSTKYAAAQSMANLGGQSIDGVNYFINLSACALDTYINFGEVTTKEVKQNTEVGLLNLDAGAILRQELSDAFIVPAGTQPQVSFVEGKFDAIGRFSFSKTPAAATGVTCNWNADDQLLTVTGYDYSTQYISKGKTGNKLRIRLTGVLPDETKNIHNTPISNTDTTALYQNNTKMGQNNMFKALPTKYFNIPTYTYVLDYGLQMLDTDVNGTLKAVSAGLTKQDVNNYITKSENELVEIQEGSENLLYSANPELAKDSGYVLIQRPEGNYDWFEIEVVPASNVLYEETALDIANDNGTYSWSKVGTPTTTRQDLSSENDVYGYDSSYANSTGFSNGTHYFAKVDANNKRSDTATFTFAGTSFDLISACGANTGMLVVQVGKKVFIVDTYCNTTELLGSNGFVNQVPVVNWKADEYGTYEVKVTAAYFSNANGAKTSVKRSKIDTGLEMSSAEFAKPQDAVAMLESVGITGVSAEDVELIWFDDNSVLNGGTGVAPQKKGSRAYTENGVVTLKNYIDGIRVYNPLQDTSDYIESEQGAAYFNVIDELAKTENGTLTGTFDSKVAFVTGNLAEGTLSFANYESIGPEGEFYLKASSSDTEALSFKVPTTSGGSVMVSLRAVNGSTTAKINGKVFEINSATEMYYDITDVVSTGDVVIENAGSGILSVNNIKLTNPGSTPGLIMLDEGDIEAVQYYASMEPVQATVKNGVVTPIVEEEEIPGGDITPDVPEDGNISDEKEEFSFMSLIEMLLSFIEDVLRNAFGLSSLN